jgi:hypothetical protein
MLMWEVEHGLAVTLVFDRDRARNFQLRLGLQQRHTTVGLKEQHRLYKSRLWPTGSEFSFLFHNNEHGHVEKMDMCISINFLHERGGFMDHY